MHPTVSIGLPVYNGEKFLGAAIDSILAQTFTDFELIICDNCSTDQTEAICRAYAAADSRVRYYRNERNLGASRNYNLTFSLATGRYFKWATHDDVLKPTFLERCITVLENDPTLVLCHSQTQFIDEQGEPINISGTSEFIHEVNGQTLRFGIDSSERNCGSQRVDERFRSIVLQTVWCYEIFGVTRTDVLRRTTLQEHFYGTDKVLLAEMSILGRFAQVPEALFLNRRHLTQSANLTTSKARQIWNAPLAKRHNAFPRLMCLRGYLRAALRGSMTFRERLGCFGVIVRYVTQVRRWNSLIREISRPWIKTVGGRTESDRPVHKVS